MPKMQRKSLKLRMLDERIRRRSDPAPRFDLFASMFENRLSELGWKECTTCPRKFPDLKLVSGKCEFCSNARGRVIFTIENDMDPGMVPPVLQNLLNLTIIEEILIARVHPVISLYKIRGNQTAYSGNVINFRQDITHLFSSLPPSPSDINAVVLACRTTPHGLLEFKVRSNIVRNALRWLKENHRYYHDIVIDEDILSQLPTDGDYASLLPSLDEDDIDTETDTVNESFFPNISQLDQETVINDRLKSIEWPQTGTAPLDEFRTEGYIVQAFPTLFPYGKADLNYPRLHKVSFNEYFKFLFQYKDQRFAKHKRFRFFAMNSMMRWTALNVGNIYIKNLANSTSLDVIMHQIESNPALANSIMYYGASLRGTRSYWKQRCCKLLDMVDQIGTPSVFFTLSAADYHWPHLFKLITPGIDPLTLSDQQRMQIMHENPLLTAWFFKTRVNIFMKEFVDKFFKCKDAWMRYELQWRGSPHIHGLLWLEDIRKNKSKPRMDTSRHNK